MNTDRTFYRLATEFPEAVPALLEMPGQTNYRAVSPVVKKEHRIDLVLESDDPLAPRLMVEFQGYRDESLYFRLCAEAGMYCEAEHFDGVLLLVVIFTQEAFARDLKAPCWGLEGGTTVGLRPLSLVLNEEHVARLVDAGHTELLPLLALCVSPAERIPTEACSWGARIESSHLIASQKFSLKELLANVLVQRLSHLGLEEVERMLGGLGWENTQAGRDLIQIGVQRGTRSCQRMVLRTLRQRLGELPARLETAIEQITSLETLEDLLSIALTTNNLSAFAAEMNQRLSE